MKYNANNINSVIDWHIINAVSFMITFMFYFVRHIVQIKHNPLLINFRQARKLGIWNQKKNNIALNISASENTIDAWYCVCIVWVGEYQRKH